MSKSPAKCGNIDGSIATCPTNAISCTDKPQSHSVLSLPPEQLRILGLALSMEQQGKLVHKQPNNKENNHRIPREMVANVFGITNLELCLFGLQQQNLMEYNQEFIWLTEVGRQYCSNNCAAGSAATGNAITDNGTNKAAEYHPIMPAAPHNDAPKTASVSLKLPRAQQTIMDTIKSLEKSGNIIGTEKDGISRTLVESATGMNHNTFAGSLSQLKNKGLIQKNANFLWLTDLGRNYTPGNSNAAATMATNAQKAASLAIKLPRFEQRILSSILSLEKHQRSKGAKHNEISRSWVLSFSGIKLNTFCCGLSALKKKGLIQYNPQYVWLTELGRLKANGNATNTTMSITGNSNGNENSSLFPTDSQDNGQEDTSHEKATNIAVSGKVSPSLLMAPASQNNGPKETFHDNTHTTNYSIGYSIEDIELAMARENQRTAQVQQALCQKFNIKPDTVAGRVFHVVKDGRAHDRNTMAEKSGCSATTLAHVIGSLRRQGILNELPRSKVWLTDHFFPFGRLNMEDPHVRQSI